MTAQQNIIKDSDITSLRLYLKEISKIPLLSSKEETLLTQQLQQNSNDNQQIFNKLVTSNLRFVVFEAKKYINYGLPLSDLISEGNVGLIKAAQKFNPNKKVKFITYARWWIRHDILIAIFKHSSIVTIPKSKLDLLKQIKKVIFNLQQYDNNITLQSVAEKMNLPESLITDILILSNKKELSLDHYHTQPEKYDTKHPFIEQIQINNTIDPLETIYQQIIKEKIKQLLKNTLTTKERKILKLRYGLNGNRTHTLREIGKKFNLSRERIRQIEHEAIQKLKHPAKRELFKQLM